jgi:hypothetical protein
MLNASFEQGSTPHPDHGNIFVPDHWTVFWRDGGYAPHDTAKEHPYSQPEMLVIPAEEPYLDPLRVTHGTQAVKLFTFYRIHDAGLYQRVAVPKGSKVTFTCKAHAWSSTDDDPHTSDQEGDAYHNFNFKVGIDPYGDIDPWDESLVWQLGKPIYDFYGQVPALSVTAQADYVTLFIRSTCKYPFKHNDAYIDDCELLIELPEPEPPTNVPPPGGYDKEYWIVRDSISLERRRDIYTLAGSEQKTCGPSADDARAWATELCDSGRTVRAVPWDIPESEQANWTHYFEVREPRIVVEFRGSQTQPPPRNEPDPIIHYSGNFVGLQHAFQKQNWDHYVRDASPTVTKCFEISATVIAKKLQPQMLSVWRKFVDMWETAHMLNDGRVGAQRLLDQYTGDINAYSQSEGISVQEVLAHLDVCESLNETIPSNNATVINMAVDFDCYFSEALHARYGTLVKAGLLNVAIGNPLESEVDLLLPCAKKSHELGDLLGYHGYWASNEHQTWMIDLWNVHSGRWQEWDKVFVSNGYYPTYYLGECGIVYSTDGSWLNPQRGWKSCGDIENYIEQIIDFNELLDIWNAANQGRCYGGTIFIYGGWGWEDYDIGVGDLALLTDTMKQYA